MTIDTLIIFTRFGMGVAPAELQQKLAKTFLSVLPADGLPGAIAFYGEGVKLCCNGSPVIEQLQAIAAAGVPLILCQTCLDYFALRSSVRVGVGGGMGDIMAAMSRASKVISV